MKPMLCHHYSKHRHKLSWPCALQPKLDGIRMLYQNGTMQSRNARTSDLRTWPTHRLLHIREQLSWCPPHLILDGEIYIHGKSRQEINGLAGVNNIEDTAKTTALEYWVFDCVDANDLNASFQSRHGLLSYMHNPSPSVHLLRTKIVMSEVEADALYYSFKQSRFEGAIYRNLDSPYGFVEQCGNQENRWAYTQKRKDHLDDEFEIIGVVEGEGKYTNMVGALVLIDKNGRSFNAGSGLTDEQRTRYWKDSPAGLIATIRYDILSDAGVPLQPRVEEVYE